MTTLNRIIDVNDFYTGRRFDHVAYADAVYQSHPFLADVSGRYLLAWNGASYARPFYKRRDKYGAWSVLGIAGYDDPPPKSIMVRDALIRRCIEDGRIVHTSLASGVLDDSPVAIFANGIVNLRDGSLRPHTPDLFVEGNLSIIYDPDMPVPSYDQWLQDRGLSDQISKMESVTATIFDSTYRHPRAVVLSGVYESGKTTWGELVATALKVNLQGSRDRARQLNNHFGNVHLRDVMLDSKRWKLPALLTFSNNVHVTRELNGPKTSVVVDRLLTDYPTNALHVIETVGDGWGVPARIHRRWERDADRNRFDVFLFMKFIPENDRLHVDVRKELYKELPGIVARWIQSRIRLSENIARK